MILLCADSSSFQQMAIRKNQLITPSSAHVRDHFCADFHSSTVPFFTHLDECVGIQQDS